MWRPGAGRPGLERERFFDAIIEPRDIAESYDRGLQATRASAPFRSIRFLLHEPQELLSRDTLRAELGLDPDRPALLVQLGSGNNYDYGEMIQLACAHAARRNVQVAVAEWLIAETDLRALPGDVLHLRTYPLSRYFKAFDGAISAVGYNSFHELIACSVPAIFIPNEHPTMDDQLMRAQFAQRRRPGAVHKDLRAVSAPERPRPNSRPGPARPHDRSLPGNSRSAMARQPLPGFLRKWFWELVRAGRQAGRRNRHRI